jgi:hypothetical protein
MLRSKDIDLVPMCHTTILSSFFLKKRESGLILSTQKGYKGEKWLLGLEAWFQMA